MTQCDEEIQNIRAIGELFTKLLGAVNLEVFFTVKLYLSTAQKS